jgi:hypothetical protein
MPFRDKEKDKSYKKTWYERNREKVKARSKAYREHNREEVAAYHKTWYERNREKVKARSKAYREHNREEVAAYYKDYHKKIKARSKAYREHNRERIAAVNKNYRQRNPEKIAAFDKKRRCSKRNSTVPLSAKEQDKLLLLETIRLELQRETGRKYHIDHILPIRYGGIHHPINLRILEKKENLSKQAKILPEAIILASEHFQLYNERVSPERAWQFVRELAEGLGLSDQEVQNIIAGKQIKENPTLKEFM